jgi:hypothetical protein
MCERKTLHTVDTVDTPWTGLRKVDKKTAVSVVHGTVDSTVDSETGKWTPLGVLFLHGVHGPCVHGVESQNWNVHGPRLQSTRSVHAA